MLMTNQEASTKWCPMRRYSPHDPQPAPAPDEVTCKGDRCGMWRWASFDVQMDYGTTEHGVIDRVGYCGLAGGVAL